MLRAALTGAALLLLAGCAARGPVLPAHLGGAGDDRAVELTDTPFFPQTKYYCGPASLATVLYRAGKDVDPDTLAPSVYLPDRKGSLQIEMTAAVRRYGLMPYRVDASLESLLGELRAGRPVLVFQNLGIRLLPVWHYAVVIGYDPKADSIFLRSGTERRKVMDAADFMETWERADKWALVVLSPGEMPADPDPGRYLSSAAAMAKVNPPQVSTRLMDAAVKQWPENALAHFALGNALYDQGDRQGAIASYRRAVTLDPALMPARNNLAHVLSELGCRDEALETIDRALSRAPGKAADLRKTLSQTRDEIRQREQASDVNAGTCR